MIGYDNYWLKCIWLKNCKLPPCLAWAIGQVCVTGEESLLVVCSAPWSIRKDLNTHLHEFLFYFTHYGDTEKLSVGLYLTNCFELTEKVFLFVASSKLKYILLSKRIFCAIFKVNKVNIMNPQQHIQERTTYMINIIKISFNQNTFSVSIMLGKFGT